MTATTIRVQMAQRKDTAANWTAANPILLSGEIGYETDTKKFKIGDGTTNWSSLAYLPIPDGSGNLTITGNLEIGTTGTLTFEGSTADGFETTLAVTDPTADRTITFPDVSGTVVTTGDTGTVTSAMLADGTIVDADVSATAEIAVSKLANGTANQVLVTDGTDVSWSDDLTLAGNLTVNGTTTTVNTQTLVVEDKNIELGVVGTPTDLTADGGGITLKGTTDKTINWIDATDSWTSSEHIELASSKSYRINGAEVLSSTTLGSGVTGSSLTSVGTISSGTWQGTAIDAAYLDSTVVTTGDTGTVTSTMIADGTIVDGDINASAAIALSKLATGALPTAITVASANIVDGTIVDADISGSAEIAVSKLADGAARQLLQTDAAGTGVEWTSNVDVPGTLDVTSTATFDSIASHSLGSAAAPTITFTGDTNTGIYSPGADQVALATGGTGRLFVDANGNVGVGAANPVNSANYSSLTLQGTTGGQIALRAGATLKSYFYNDASKTTIGSVDDFVIATTGSITERLRITSDGKVGLGTSAPDSPLQVIGNTPAHFRRTSAGFCNVLLSASTAQWSTGVHSDGYYAITHEGVGERLRIDSSGRVGVGTTSPAVAFEVSATSPIIRSTHSLTGDYLQLFHNGGGAYLDYSADDLIIRSASSTERARIDSSGRLLVGTSSDSGGALLQVNGDRVRIATAKTPASASDTGTTGEVCWDANYIYVCTATDTWKRAALSTW